MRAGSQPPTGAIAVAPPKRASPCRRAQRIASCSATLTAALAARPDVKLCRMSGEDLDPHDNPQHNDRLAA